MLIKIFFHVYMIDDKPHSTFSLVFTTLCLHKGSSISIHDLLLHDNDGDLFPFLCLVKFIRCNTYPFKSFHQKICFLFSRKKIELSKEFFGFYLPQKLS